MARIEKFAVLLRKGDKFRLTKDGIEMTRGVVYNGFIYYRHEGMVKGEWHRRIFSDDDFVWVEEDDINITNKEYEKDYYKLY